MIIKFGILIALILGALIFVGVKMGEDINVREVKMFFFILYGMSIFTVFNIVISVYFFTSLRNKRGPPGPKGKPGRLGDRGDHGDCVEENCLKKSLETIIVDTLEKELSKKNMSDGTTPQYKPLKAFEKILICSYVNQLYRFKPTEFRKFFTNDVSTDGTLETNTIGSPVVGTSVFKIQELKKSIINLLNTPPDRTQTDNFLYISSNREGFLNAILSTKITNSNTHTYVSGDATTSSANNFILNSENCA